MPANDIGDEIFLGDELLWRHRFLFRHPPLGCCCHHLVSFHFDSALIYVMDVLPQPLVIAIKGLAPEGEGGRRLHSTVKHLLNKYKDGGQT